jgi:hypothetical protein
VLRPVEAGSASAAPQELGSRELLVELVVAGHAGTCWRCQAPPEALVTQTGRRGRVLVVCGDCGASLGGLSPRAAEVRTT